MHSLPESPTSKLREARRKLLRSLGVFRAIGPSSQSPNVHYPKEVLPLETPENKARLEAMADAFAALLANMTDLAAMHRSINDFNESFASFLYGFLITMFCNGFPGSPTREQYEVMQTRSKSMERVDALKERLLATKHRNAHLKEQLTQQRAADTRPKLHLGELFSQRPLPRQRPLPPKTLEPSLEHRKILVARDDSFSTTDTFIEAPGSTQAAHTTSSRSGVVLGSAPPNLDQPPRYMRGLFEIPNASNTRRNIALRSNVKTRQKPGLSVSPLTPGRTSDTTKNAPRAPGYTSSISSQRAVSAAAQRAQRARADRKSSRPPFR